MSLNQDAIKQKVGKRAAELVQKGMLVGLGSGTTAVHFIDALIERSHQGLHFTAVSSSVASLKRAAAGGIDVLEMDNVTSIDLVIDGADEIDLKNRMIKGGGGAHVREKIIASAAQEMVVIVDESKCVETLGAFGLPVEIIPFGYWATIEKLNRLGYKGVMRQNSDGSLHITDNTNYLFDIHTPKAFTQPEQDHERIVTTPGVVDSGFFFNLASKVLVGYADGTVAFRT